MAEGIINVEGLIIESIEKIGLSWNNSPTTSQIFAAMPPSAIFICQTTANSGSAGYSLYQEIGESGIVMIFKSNNYRGGGFFIKYDTNSGKNYIFKILKTKGSNSVEWSPNTDLGDTYKEYTLTKDSGATNFTLIRSHACKQGKTAFIQVVASVTSSQDESSVTVIKLPADLYPAYGVETRICTYTQGLDCNINVSTNGNFTIQRMPSGTGGNFRINLSYPTAT